MSRSFGELFNDKAGCGYSANNRTVDAIDEANGEFGSNGIGNFDIAKGEQTGDFCSAANNAKAGNLCGFGVNDVHISGGIVMRPVNRIGVHIVGHGLNECDLQAGGADLGAMCVLKIDAVKHSVLITATVCITVCIYC